MTMSHVAGPPHTWRDHRLKRYLAENTGCGVHIIDPFKFDRAVAIEKAVAAERCGARWIILASTDCDDFDTRMRDLVPAITRAVSIPTVLHFPPTPGQGFPVVPGATGSLWPALLGSTHPYFVWQSLVESAASWSHRLDAGDWPEPVLCGALTVGEDPRTQKLLGTEPLDESPSAVRRAAAEVRRLGMDMTYLYSRHSSVSPRTCEMFREELLEDQLVFVSGNVRRPSDIARYLDAGADYVGFAGACEGPDWQERLPEMLGVSR